MAVLLAWPCVAQDQDMFLHGTMRDVRTGEVLRGSLQILDRTDPGWSGHSETNADGSFDMQLYSYFSSYYVVSFTAADHRTRQAAFDMTAPDRPLGAGEAWEIDMDVMLFPTDTAADSMANAPVGVVTYDPEQKTLRWTAAGPHATVTVKRTQRKELNSASAMMAPLWRKDGVILAGKVVDHWTERPIKGVEVIVTGADGRSQRVTTNEFGLYGLVLPCDRPVRITYTKKGLVSKMVEVDATGIPAGERGQGFRVQVDMRLFAPLQGEDLSFLEEPIGKARYEIASDQLRWDMDYTVARWDRLKPILDRHPMGH